MRPIVVGVLALQGAFSKHIEMLKSLGVRAIEVRSSVDLNKCQGLIIPGGESTTIFKQIKFSNMASDIVNFSKNKPIFGTCAGLILMSKKIIADSMNPFKILDIEVERNAFGRQAESFITDIDVHLESKNPQKFPGIFIRAPRIKFYASDVEVLAEYQDEPILIQQGFHLGAIFHPELTNDPSIHLYFLKQIAKFD